MRYIKGRSNLSCTIFVPWDCKNHCKFCTSKQMYKERTCDIDAIIAQIKKINENPLIQEFVLTGGEPLADLEQCQKLIDIMEKPVYINTTFPTFVEIPGTIETAKIMTMIDFINKNRYEFITTILFRISKIFLCIFNNIFVDSISICYC